MPPLFYGGRLGCLLARVCLGSSVKWLLRVTKRSPAVLYDMAKSLAQVLSLPLVLHSISAPRLRGLKQNDPRVHKLDNVPPEVALISAAIVVLRLVYGFDGRTRYVSWYDSPVILIVIRTLEFPLTLETQPMPSRSWTSTCHY